MLPIQSLQHKSKSLILSRGFIFQLRSTMSSIQPSGISPSNTGNINSFVYSSLCNGMVGLNGTAPSVDKYSAV